MMGDQLAFMGFVPGFLHLVKSASHEPGEQRLPVDLTCGQLNDFSQHIVYIC